MSDYTNKHDLGSVTLDASGGTDPDKVAGEVPTDDAQTATLVLDGDSNSTDLTVNLYANETNGADFGDFDTGAYTNVDLTTAKNNKKVLTPAIDAQDTAELEVEIVNNNTGSATTVSAKANTTDVA